LGIAPRSIPGDDNENGRNHSSIIEQPEKVSNLRPIGNLPPHLGWDSWQLTAHLRHARELGKKNAAALNHSQAEIAATSPPAPQLSQSLTQHETNAAQPASQDAQCQPITATAVNSSAIRLHPDLGLGMLRTKETAPGRIWLLLRWIDQRGSGSVSVTDARRLLCDNDSALRICGWRHLRSLLARGEGRFWAQNNGRIWLRSVPKTAHNLGITRLGGRPVDVPVAVLTQGIGHFRAHLYAAFHSGRRKAKPISRASLTKISHVSPRSQQNYEKRAEVQKQKNYAIGSPLHNKQAREEAWQQGSAAFKWDDCQGIFGTPQRAHMAWQLPNSYTGPHKRRPRGRQREFNRELADLSTKGMTGNNSCSAELLPRRYHEHAAGALRSTEQRLKLVYWRGRQRGMWFYLEVAKHG
jgi:hypothetical protein